MSYGLIYVCYCSREQIKVSTCYNSNIYLNIISINIPECQDKFYGRNCSQQCGHCLNHEPCNKDTGHCNKGCQSYFQYPLCQGNSITI